MESEGLFQCYQAGWFIELYQEMLIPNLSQGNSYPGGFPPLHSCAKQMQR
jgi:hypothetical protein